MEFDEKFVKNLTLNAQLKCGSVMDLSIEIGASEKSIYKWINGTSMPKAEYLLKMLSMMGYLVIPTHASDNCSNGSISVH